MCQPAPSWPPWAQRGQLSPTYLPAEGGGRQPAGGGQADFADLLRSVMAALAAVQHAGLPARAGWQPGRLGPPPDNAEVIRSTGQRAAGAVLRRVADRISLGAQAAAARAQDPGHGWLQRFVVRTWGAMSTDPANAMLRMRVTRALQMHLRAQEGNPGGSVGRGHRAVGTRVDRVKPSKRLRQVGGQGRPQSLPDLSVELLQWWTDMAVTLQARVVIRGTHEPGQGHSRRRRAIHRRG